MEIIDNINRRLRDDLETTITPDSRLSVAAACFSIYAFHSLKEQLGAIDELRFIFTSPAFVSEKAPREKREFLENISDDTLPNEATGFKNKTTNKL
jgi:hypothetical protein